MCVQEMENVFQNENRLFTRLETHVLLESTNPTGQPWAVLSLVPIHCAFPQFMSKQPFDSVATATHSMLETFMAQWMGKRVDMVSVGSARQRSSVSTFSGLSCRHAVCRADSPYRLSWFTAVASLEASICAHTKKDLHCQNPPLQLR